MSSILFRRSIYLSLFASGVLARYANVTRRADDVDASQFQAADDIDVKALYDFVKAGSSNVVATYGTCNECDQSINTDIHSQDDKMKGVLTFMSDMDIDCDGINWQCPGNPDGQSETTFGHADTYQMPWYVLPDEWYESQGIVANNLGAVICDGKMFYAVFADSNGDSPQVIGETSLVLGNACYPDAGFSGAVGHQEADIAYIVFAGDAPDGVGEETLDYGPLKELGDRKIRELLAAVASPSGGGQDPNPTEDPNEDPEPTETGDEPSEPTETSDEPEEPTETPEEPEEPTETESPEPEPTETETETEPSEPTETETPQPTPSTCKRSNLRRRHRQRRRMH